MSSTASSSTIGSSSSLSAEESRPQAGPLPTKRGEIGFTEEVQAEAESVPTSVASLPERHPADRDAQAPATVPTATAAVAAPVPTPDDASSTNSMPKKKIFLAFRNLPSWHGIHLKTLLLLALQVLFFCGTVAGWALTAIAVSKGASSNQNSSSSNNSDSSNQMNGTSAIFIHVVFGVTCLAQALFLERRIFTLRAERYAFLHPGEMLPTSRQPRRADPSFAFSPWNRPPIPTYAAALAQSGGGTGDVEDHLIAPPPPPAYGNTRGSRLLLTGFLRDSLRAQRPASVASQQTTGGERPLSYASHDEEWDIIQDADRARQLEDTLSSLERPRTRT
ncbi:hypothetical protein C8J56DRAFT_1010746 [Mycena floridula]|nr:hypothetical protein C8J56DRAFT_1010746 [Mycena floridula]